jgi:hypothetical protein
MPTTGSDFWEKHRGEDQAARYRVEAEIIPFNDGADRAGNDGAASVAILDRAGQRSDSAPANDLIHRVTPPGVLPSLLLCQTYTR